MARAANAYGEGGGFEKALCAARALLTPFTKPHASHARRWGGNACTGTAGKTPPLPLARRNTACAHTYTYRLQEIRVQVGKLERHVDGMHKVTPRTRARVRLTSLPTAQCVAGARGGLHGPNGASQRPVRIDV